MAKDVASDIRPEVNLDATGLRVALIASRFNDHITNRLLDGARRELVACGGAQVSQYWVPGAFELPFAARTLAASGIVDAIVCVGCVIRGETTHYEEVAGQCAAGIQRVQLDTGVPVAFGVLTTEDLDQALARSQGPGGHNVGAEGVRVAIEMARFVEEVQRTSTR